MAIVDATETIYDLINSNYTIANVDNITPIIDYSENRKRVNVRNDAIFIYLRNIKDEKIGLGWNKVKRTYTIVIDIYTTRDRAHFTKIIKEIERIMNENAVNPPDNFSFLDPDGLFQIPQNYPDFRHGVKEVYLIDYVDARD